MKNKLLKATAVSPANIAFIKFWGKKDSKLNIPFNDSISMNMGGCLSTTTVEFSPRFKGDRVVVNGREDKGDKKDKISEVLNIIRKISDIGYGSKVVSKNNFPSDAGMASSASGFSALALAGSAAAGLNLSKKELSIVARLGSGSASRSVVDGFAEWKKGKDSSSSYAIKMADPDFWKICDIVAVVEKGKKKKGSTEGHSLVKTSPFYETRLKNINSRLKEIKKAFYKKDFNKFGSLVEEEAVELHVIAMTSKPPIYYWNPGTLAVMKKVMEVRETGIPAFFTMDAGPNVHVICEEKNIAKINKTLKKIPGVIFTVVNLPVKGSYLTDKHLF